MFAGAVFTACTDNIAVGDASLDKATSSTATIDTVFQNAEYTRQFLVGIYSKQYYGLPYMNGGANAPHAGNPYAGKRDGLTDCWHQFWNGAAVYGQYYTGSMTATTNRTDGLDGPLYSYDKEFQWKSIRAAHIFLENLPRVPEMNEEEKSRLRAEARCLMVSYFFETFQNYGGIPIMDHSLAAAEATNAFPRNTVEECVDWMVAKLDSAIAEPSFPWVTADPASQCGRWTKAGAMALKCKILQFAASPLLNPKDGKPYCADATPDVLPYIMYAHFTNEEKTESVADTGDYQKRWDRFAEACEQFFAIQGDGDNGVYHLQQATDVKGSNANAKVPYYRLAYRKGYFLRESPEILHSVRVMGYDNFSTARYCWHSWYTASVPRNAYTPTQEYVEKFSYADGEPFNWTNAAKKTYKASATEPEITINYDKDGREVSKTVSNFLTNSKTGAVTRNAKSLHQMFVAGTIPAGGRQQNATLTRDPRLYEEVIVNGLPKNLDWTTASMSGYAWELWYNGADGGTGVLTESNTMFGSGYGFNKYYLGDGTTTGGDNLRYQTQWVALSLAEMYLAYAEALVMKTSPDVPKAIKMIDKVRSRVNLPTFANQFKNSTYRNAIGYSSTSETAALTANFKTINGVEISEFMEELLNERVRELGLTDARWFDMIRYKRTDWMTKQLHGLKQQRMMQVGAVFQTRDNAWVGADRDNDAASTQPLDFLNSVKEIKGNKRVLWGMDPQSSEVTKWLLAPLPQIEINKNYGLVQNPGW